MLCNFERISFTISPLYHSLHSVPLREKVFVAHLYLSPIRGVKIYFVLQYIAIKYN